MQRALAGMLRWATRSEVRRDLWTGAGVRLSVKEAWLLQAIGSLAPVRLTYLAASQGVDKSTLTPQVQRLEAEGLVERRPDPHDRRAALLALSPKGRRVCRGIAVAGAHLLDEKLAGWPAEDRRALSTLLGRFVDELEGDLAAHEAPRDDSTVAER